jgi:hypothetical protein
VKRKLIVAVAALAMLVVPVAAQAEPVQQFSFQVKNIKPGGLFTLLFNSRAFDTTGAPPPNPVESYLRLPAGATLRKQFLNKRFYCNGEMLRHSIDSRPQLSYRPFTKLVADLSPVIKELGKEKSKRAQAELKNVKTCQRVRIGGGTAKFDPRTLNLPALSHLIPANFSVFFAKPSVPGAVGGFTVLGAAVESDPVVKRTPIVAAVHAVLPANFVNDPTPDGLYGYKLLLPPNQVNGLDVRLAELHVVTNGLSLKKGECLKQGKHGRCAKRQKKTLFWFTQPKCPPSGDLSFLAFYDYDPPTADVTSTFQLTCPKFM